MTAYEYVRTHDEAWSPGRGWEPLYRRVPVADAPTCYAKDAITWPVAIPCDGAPYVATHLTANGPAGDIPGCYRHAVMYASHMNVVHGGVRVSARAVTA